MARIKQDISEVREGILEHIRQERQLQDGKWGVQDHEDLQWLAILMEEVGEVAKAILQRGNVAEELVQVAAVAVAWLENMEDRARGLPKGRPAPIPIWSQEDVRVEPPSPSAEQGDDYASLSLEQAVDAAKYWAEQHYGRMSLQTFRLEKTRFDKKDPIWIVEFSVIPPAIRGSEHQRSYRQVYAGIFVGDDMSDSALRDQVKQKFFKEHKRI